MALVGCKVSGMRESARQFFKGPVWDLVVWAGVLGTFVWLAQVTADRGSPWMWVAVWALVLSLASFLRFHKMREQLEAEQATEKNVIHNYFAPVTQHLPSPADPAKIVAPPTESDPPVEAEAPDAGG
jgi:ABC-type nickel/cobalt efflux system permease component RcnA